MPALLPLIGGMLLTLVSNIVFRVLVALGVGWVTFTGAQGLVDTVANLVDSQLGGLPLPIKQTLGLLQIGVCINILISAYTIKMTMMGFSRATGALAMMVFMPKGAQPGGGS